MQPPQTGRQPLPATSDEVRQALRKQHPQDNVDYFATDPNPDIRRLGKLALRRDDVNDQFALGDLCARRVLTDDKRLLVFYVAKTLIGYRRAIQFATNDVDRALAHRAVDEFISWTLDTARAYPTRRNLAVALWAVAETESSALLALVDRQASWDDETVISALLDAFRANGSSHGTAAASDEQATHFDADNRQVALSQSQATVADYEMSAAISYEVEHDPLSPLEDPLDATLDERPVDSLALSAGGMPSDASSSTSDRHAASATPEDAHEFRIGDRIEGRYEVADLRRGGMGIVYLCYDHETRTPVAIKSFQGRFLENDRAVARFVQEAVTWIHLDKHRHIVQARLVQNVAGRPHIMLEHISGPEGLGPDLKSWIEHNRLDLKQSIEFGLHIALGMQHATRKVPGLVHRDLKPANILVTHDGIAKVTDFGLVRSVEAEDLAASSLEAEMMGSYGSSNDRLTRVGAVIGTAPYLSPEQCQSRDVDVRSDIYAFGCLLYEMLVGRPIFKVRKFEAWLHAHLHEQPTFEADAIARIPARLRTLVLRCVEKAPHNRPPNWGTIVDELSAIYQDVAGQAPVLEVTGPALQARELMDKGYSLTELRRYEEAIEAYNAALTLQPRYAWAWARKGRTLRLLYRHEEALVAYERALELDPRYAWAWRGKGMILERLDRWEEALTCYQKAAQINPKDAWHWCNQAEVLQHLGRDSEAVPLLYKALETDPSHATSWARLGQVYRQMKLYEESVAAYEQALKLDTTYGWAHNGYGLALKMVGRTKEALMAFKKAARYQPDDVWHWYNITETLIDLRQFEDAVEPAFEATRVDPEHAYSWAKLGQVLRYVRRLDEALEAYDHAIALDPAYAWAWNGKGIVLEQLGRYEEALNAYQSATGDNEGDVWHYYNQGNVLVLLGRLEEAIPLLRRAIEMKPGHTRSWARLGNALRQLGRYPEALEAYEQATASDPNFGWAWNEYGITLDAVGRPQEALEAYRNASFSSPDDPIYLYQQADLLIQFGRNKEAVSLLDRALTLDNSNANTWAKHGQALRRIDHLEESLRSFNRAVELDPGYAWAWNGRGLTLSALNARSEAIDSFRRATELSASDVWFWYNLGDALASAGRWDEALDALDRAAEINPEHAESLAKTGQTLRRLGREQEALNAYDQALAVNPHYAWAWNGRAQTLSALDRREEAVASYERAVSEDPGIIWYYTNWVDLLLDMQRRQEALVAVEKAVRNLPLNPIGWGHRGKVLRRMGEYEAAADAYRHATELDEEYGWAWNGLGLAQMALNQPHEALESFQIALRCSPQDAWFWHNYGDALAATGDTDGARQAYEHVLSIAPSHSLARQKLRKLRKKPKDTD
jgi:tetratricopeptide (TPR) repeat protein/tRNA A-37 threonylcarbamoyl transferase component Bud32